MLKLSDINKIYDNGSIKFQALQNISLEVKEGEMVALCGPSGSGKSTLLNICGLLDLDYQGQIILAGEVLSRNKKRAMELRRAHLGFVFQRFNLVPVMTAFENVEYPLLLNKVPTKERYDRVQGVLDAVGLADFSNKRPDQLSGGQQQRVAIARAVVNNPLLIIADEPTASLDSATAHQIVELMKTLGEQHNTTFVIASHDDRMTQHCDRTLHLEDGKLINENQSANNKPSLDSQLSTEVSKESPDNHVSKLMQNTSSRKSQNPMEGSSCSA